MAKAKVAAPAAGATGSGGLGLGAIIAIIIGILIILAIIGYSVLGVGNSAQVQSQLPYFANTNQTAPASLSALTQESSQQASESLSALVAAGSSNSSQLQIQYAGHINFKGSGLESVLAVSSPLIATYSRYNSAERLSVNATSVSAFGNFGFTYINTTNATYVCTNLNSTALSKNNVEGAFLGARTLTCTISSSLAGIGLNRLAHFDLSALQNYGVQLSYNQVYQSNYNGMPCTVVEGIITLPGTNSTNSGSGQFEECLSDKNYIPLSLYVYLSSGGGSFSLGLNETSIFNSTSLQSVSYLPGPVV